VGAVLRQLDVTELIAFRTVPEEFRAYLKDNLDKLRADADNEMNWELDLINKGKRQLLAELIEKTDPKYLKEMHRKAEETSSPENKSVLF